MVTMVTMAMLAMAMILRKPMVSVGNHKRDLNASVDAGALEGDRSLFDIISVVSFAVYITPIVQIIDQFD